MLGTSGWGSTSASICLVRRHCCLPFQWDCYHYHTSCVPTAVAREREVEGDLFLWDMGEGLGFRPGTFDGVISISALQWLCNADRKSHHPPKRLYQFFTSLYACMVCENNVKL